MSGKILQKAVIVQHSDIQLKHYHKNPTVTEVPELDKMISEGWTIAGACPMPSSLAKGDGCEHRFCPPSCFVILEMSSQTLKERLAELQKEIRNQELETEDEEEDVLV